jgi:hypothetical protein
VLGQGRERRRGAPPTRRVDIQHPGGRKPSLCSETPPGAFRDTAIGTSAACGIRAPDGPLSRWGTALTPSATLAAISLGRWQRVAFEPTARRPAGATTPARSPLQTASCSVASTPATHVWPARRRCRRRMLGRHHLRSRTTAARRALLELRGGSRRRLGPSRRRRTSTLLRWGADQLGQASPRGELRFESVSSGNEHACGVLADTHEMRCRGRHSHGSASPPEGIPFASVVVGDELTCGVRAADGKVACWCAFVVNDR